MMFICKVEGGTKQRKGIKDAFEFGVERLFRRGLVTTAENAPNLECNDTDNKQSNWCT